MRRTSGRESSDVRMGIAPRGTDLCGAMPMLALRRELQTGALWRREPSDVSMGIARVGTELCEAMPMLASRRGLHWGGLRGLWLGSNAHARVPVARRLGGGARHEPYSPAKINISGPFLPTPHGSKFRELKR